MELFLGRPIQQRSAHVTARNDRNVTRRQAVVGALIAGANGCAAEGFAMGDDVTRINVGFGEIVHSASFYDSSGAIVLAAGSVQFFSRIELRRPNGTLDRSASFEHECLAPPLPGHAVRTGPHSIMLAQCGENPVLDRVFGSAHPSTFGERLMAWARAQGMRSILIYEASITRNPDQDLNAMRSQNGAIAYWTDVDADDGVYRENQVPREFVEQAVGNRTLWPFRITAGGSEFAMRAYSGFRPSTLIGDASGWSVLSPDGLGLEIPSDHGCFYGPARLGESSPRILCGLAKDREWRVVPMSDSAPPEIAILGVAGEQVIYYSAQEQSVFTADASESRTRLSGDHANWLRAGSLLARVPDPIASAIQERFGLWDFSPSTRTILVTRPRDVLLWKF